MNGSSDLGGYRAMSTFLLHSLTNVLNEKLVPVVVLKALVQRCSLVRMNAVRTVSLKG